MSQILKRPRAKADLAEIWDYIAEDSESRADTFIETMGGKLQTLADNPSIGRARDILGESVRSFPVGRYVIFYLPLQDGIDVVRILHSARDLDIALDADD